MKRSPLKWSLLIIILSTLPARLVSQAMVADTTLGPAFANAVAFYNNSLGTELPLFNGKEYQDYLQPFNEGQPYFFTNSFQKGTVKYDGKTYENVSILYNVVSDQVIILNYSGLAKIQLIKERVDAFSLFGHSFTNIHPNSLPSTGIRAGFYDILFNGKISLLAKRTKNIQAETKQIVETKILSKDRFYIRHNNVYLEVGGPKALITAFKNKKPEIREFIKQNKINYRKNPEDAMVKIVEYYNQLIK